MSEETLEEAKREIAESLILNAFCMKRIGISFADPKNGLAFWRQKCMFVLSVCSICYLVFGEIAYIGLTLAKSPRVEDVVPLFHIFGYGALSIAKVFVLWYKKDVFKQLIYELAGIWPVPPLDEEAQLIKNKSLSALRMTHRWYFAVNVLGVWFYNLTPIGIYLYRTWQAQEVHMGYVWVSWYPFDKHKPLAHVAVYIFEIFAGQTSVWIMASTDLLFSGMASHIGLLLRLLHRRLESLAKTEQTEQEQFDEILSNIKLHQRLIRYCNDLEVAFSLSNLVNVVISSVNICCVVFVIVGVNNNTWHFLGSFVDTELAPAQGVGKSLEKRNIEPLTLSRLLEPFMEVSNKLFLGSALIQIGMLCWYADDILNANNKVSLAAYNSRWYRSSPRCRRALLFLIQRAQKPVAFTAMGFTNISLVTYSSILTRSYSYFALLYTMYNKK